MLHALQETLALSELQCHVQVLSVGQSVTQLSDEACSGALSSDFLGLHLLLLLLLLDDTVGATLALAQHCLGCLPAEVF